MEPHAWQAITPELTQTELAHLERVRDLADFIVPRPEFTRHPLMIRAAALMEGFLVQPDRGKRPTMTLGRRPADGCTAVREHSQGF